MELTFREKVILFDLLSERYYELKDEPSMSDDQVFRDIEDLYIKVGASLQQEHGKEWWKAVQIK